MVLQDGAKKPVDRNPRLSDPMRIGDVVDATGFPEAHNGFLALARGEILDSHLQVHSAACNYRAELALSGHVIDLVSVEGQVVTAIRGGTQQYT